MTEPWLEREGDERPEPSVYNFVVFCEDDVSEPEYFESFRKDHVFITAVRGQRHKKLNVDKAIAYCVEKGLIKYGNNGKPVPMFEQGFQVWCVFDRDRNREAENNVYDDASYTASIHSAEMYSINVAWSNDAFELWVLLHIDDIEGKEGNYRHRDEYYRRLVEYFKGIENPGEELQKKLASANFSYDHIKNRKVFIPIVLPILKANTPTAIERAQKLEALHVGKPFHAKVPCTTVHHLVLQLIEKGKE